MRRRAEVVRENRVLAMLSFPRVTAIAAVEAAWIVEPPVPAAGRLEEVAADRPHIAKLRRRGEAAGLAQRVGDLRIDLELAERRTRADDIVAHAPRHDPADVDERVRLEDPIPEERHDLRAAVDEATAVELFKARGLQ